MAKMTALQAVNVVLNRIGEAEVSVLTSLSTIQQVVFDNLNRSLLEICQDTDLNLLDKQGKVTTTLAANTYDPATDLDHLCFNSMRTPDGNQMIQYLTPEQFDAKYPAGISSDRIGMPEWYTYTFQKLTFDRACDSANVGKFFYYRYYSVPALYSTSTPTGTCYIPEGWDRTLLCDYATWKVMSYMGHAEEMKYWAYVFGEPQDRSPEGSLSRFKRKFSQPPARVAFTAQL